MLGVDLTTIYKEYLKDFKQEHEVPMTYKQFEKSYWNKIIDSREKRGSR